MDSSELLVIIGGLALIAITLWYFFGVRESARASKTADIQEATIVVKGGYTPDVVVVRQGVPVRFIFRREETSSCSEQVVFGDFGIVRDLPFGETTLVEFIPDKVGEFAFTCGMNMLRGKVIVRPE